MKNKILIRAIALGTLIYTASCSSFLDEDPLSTITSNTYYKTELQAEGNINSLYRRGAPTRYSSAGSAYIGPTASINSMLTGYFSNSYECQELFCKYDREQTWQNNVCKIYITIVVCYYAYYEYINISYKHN